MFNIIVIRTLFFFSVLDADNIPRLVPTYTTYLDLARLDPTRHDRIYLKL